jgi:hypothetical protein
LDCPLIGKNDVEQSVSLASLSMNLSTFFDFP